MKKSFVVLGITMLIFLVNSCEIEVPPQYFEVNGERNDLNYGFMEDWGSANDLRFRWWAVSFRSEEFSPHNYITFEIGSYENTGDGITEGTYEYDIVGGEGFFSYISIGYDIYYDDKGFPIGNLLSDEFADFYGFIDVDRDGTTNRYIFTFDIEVEYQGEFYSIVGEYEGRMRVDDEYVKIDLSSY